MGIHVGVFRRFQQRNLFTLAEDSCPGSGKSGSSSGRLIGLGAVIVIGDSLGYQQRSIVRGDRGYGW